MKRFKWLVAVLIVFAVGGCKNNSADEDDISPGEGNKWRDPNFEILTIGTFNYTDYAIYGLYLMPLNKNDIDFAAAAGVREAQPRSATEWEMGSSGPALAWDLRWKSPRKFKVWWERVFDKELFRRYGPYPKDGNMFDPYDPYTTKQTRPGSAWCEGVVEIKEQFGEPFGPPFPNMKRRELVLYFFPDGTVKGSLEFSSYEGMHLVDIAKRDELPVLRDRACLKEVPNPLYGKPKPVRMN